MAWIAGLLGHSLASGQGDLEELERLTEVNLAVGEAAGEPDAFDYFAQSFLFLRALQGRGMEIIDQLRQAGVDTPRMTIFKAVEALFLVEDGQREAAASLLHEASRDDFDLRVENSWMSCLLAWAEVAHFVGDVAAARRLYDLLTPWAGQFGTNRIYTNFTVDGHLAALATLLGEFDRAEAHFGDAERMATARGARFVAAFDDLNRAGLHLARGDDVGLERAEHYGSRALERAREGGYGNIERRATAFLADLAAA